MLSDVDCQLIDVLGVTSEEINAISQESDIDCQLIDLGEVTLEEINYMDPEMESLMSAKQDSMKILNRRILRNLILLSFCFCLFYTGLMTLINLQSTMNAASGIGPTSQTVMFGVSMLASLLLPQLLIETFGCKRVLIVCNLFFLPYMASNIYLRWDTMMASSVLMGIGNGALGSATAMYIEELAIRFKITTTGNREFVMSCFFGVYVFFTENTQIWGNLISYYVLKPGKQTRNVTSHSRCGIHFERENGKNGTNANLLPPSEDTRIVLICIYVSMGISSLIILSLFLDPLYNDIKKTGRRLQTVRTSLLASLKHLITTSQLLLIPISIFIGMQCVLYVSTITEAYIACSWGVHHVGFVTVCFGVCGAIMSLLVGPLVKCISQMAVLILAACANVATCIVLYLWEPSPDFTAAYFIIAGVWGMGDAIWWSQVTALYGLMFPNDREAAFSNLYFWSFLGFFLSYSYANYFTVAVKINILLCFLITGMIGYLIGQIKIKCTTRNEYVPIPAKD